MNCQELVDRWSRLLIISRYKKKRAKIYFLFKLVKVRIWNTWKAWCFEQAKDCNLAIWVWFIEKKMYYVGYSKGYSRTTADMDRTLPHWPFKNWYRRNQKILLKSFEHLQNLYTFSKLGGCHSKIKPLVIKYLDSLHVEWNRLLL